MEQKNTRLLKQKIRFHVLNEYVKKPGLIQNTDALYTLWRIAITQWSIPARRTFLPAEPSALQQAYALHSNSKKNSWLSLYISSMLNFVNNESSFRYIIYACEWSAVTAIIIPALSFCISNLQTFLSSYTVSVLRMVYHKQLRTRNAAE